MSKEEYLKSRIAEKSLEDQASIISKWSMSYLDPLLIVGSKKSLENEHCGPPYHTDKANYAYERINKCWNEQCEKEKPSFALALLNAFGKYKFLVASGYAVISAVFFIAPVLVSLLCYQIIFFSMLLIFFKSDLFFKQISIHYYLSHL